MTIRYSIAKTLLAVMMLYMPWQLKSEGTRNIRPFSGATGSLSVGSAANGLSGFASYTAGPNYRLHITILDTAERIYLGFFASNNNIYFRVKRPDGSIILGPMLLPKSPTFNLSFPGFIQTYQQTIDGPRTLRNDNNGYVPLIVKPDLIGDYYIEFNQGDPVQPANSNPLIDMFDITVGKSKQTINGRLWSKNWQMNTGSFSNPYFGKMYVYSTYGIVSELDFNGIKPYGFNIACNPTGTSNTGNPIIDRRSKYGNLTYPFYKLFLSPPDITAFPTGTMGTIEAKTSVVGCRDKKYCIFVKTNTDGLVETYLELNGTPGYQANSADVWLTQYLQNAGEHCIEWDGKDGLGTPINQGDEFFAYSTFKFGMTHLPMYDVENHEFGFKVKAIRPNFPQQPKMYWDDVYIHTGIALDNIVQLDGCSNTNGCHRWTNRGTDNNYAETINTWWFANTTTQSAKFTFKEDIKVDVSLDPVQITSKDTIVCYGDSISFYPLSLIDTAKFTYKWYVNDTAQPTSTQSLLLHPFYDTTNIYLEVTGKSTGCSAYDTVTVYPKQKIDISVSHRPDSLDKRDTTLCFGSNYSLYAFGDGADTTRFKHVWFSNPSGISGSQTSLTHQYFDTVTLHVRAIKKDDGCTQKDTMVLYVPSELTTADTLIHDLCNNGSGRIAVKVFGGAGKFAYNWSNNPSNNTNVNPNLSAGTYTLNISDTATGCNVNGSFTIDSLPKIRLNSITTTDIKCGVTSGSANWQASGGSGQLFYIINNGSPSQSNSLSNLTSGVYSLKIIDDSTGCSLDTSFTILQFPEFSLDSLSFTNPSCGLNNGQVSAHLSGTTTNIVAQWFGNSNSSLLSINGLAAGFYKVLLTDTLSGCQATDSVTLMAQPFLNIANIVLDTPRCNLNNGVITVNVVAGSGQYQYNWGLPVFPTNNSANNLDSGSYQISVTDLVYGCTIDTNVFLPRLAHYNIDAINITPAKCDLDNGTATAVVNGGSGTISYLWATTPTQTSASANNLPSGNVLLTVNDVATNCQTDTIINISRLPHFSIDSISLIQPKCGLNNGSATAHIGSPSAHLIYQWSGTSSGSNASLNGLSSGLLKLSVTDTLTGCNIIDSITVTAIPNISVSITAFSPRCDLNNGTLTANVIGGSGIYSYQWGNPIIGTSATISGLTNGTYPLKITDQVLGCVLDTNIVLTRMPHFSVSAIIVQPATCDLNNGQASAVAVGGTGLIRYRWNSVPVQNTAFATNLPSSPVTLRISDQTSGCFIDTIVNITRTPNFTIDSISVFKPRCNLNNGVLTPHIGTASAFLKYQWSGPVVGSNTNLTNVLSGFYRLLVTDTATGCTRRDSVQVSALPHFALQPTQSFAARCGLNNGRIAVPVSGGSGKFGFEWGNPVFSTDSALTNLNAGNYPLTVTDKISGCTESRTVTLLRLPDFTFGSASINPARCNLNNGSAQVPVVGGGGNFTYTWNTNPIQTTQQANNLNNGFYKVTVRDLASNCLHDTTIQVGRLDHFQLDSVRMSPATCAKRNGTIVAYISGGSGTFAYLWNNDPEKTQPSASGLGYGANGLKVTDLSHVCTENFTFQLDSLPHFKIDGFVTSPAKCDLNNGSAATIVTGGSGQFGFQWSGKISSFDSAITSLDSGVYKVGVVDQISNCRIDTSIVVNRLTHYDIVSVNQQPARCNLNNGSATVNINAGVGPFNYSFNGASPTANNSITGLNNGLVSIKVSDLGSGCQTDTQIVVSRLPHYQLDSIVKYQPRCGINNGKLWVNYSGGTGTLTYKWLGNNSVSDSLIGIGAGIYPFVVLDNGSACTDTLNIPLDSLPQFFIDSVKVLPARCDTTNGLVEPILSGATSNLSYIWNNGSTAPFISNLDTGTYSVTITELTANCQRTIVKHVNRVQHYSGFSASSKPAYCGLDNAIAQLSVATRPNPLMFKGPAGVQTDSLFNNLPSTPIYLYVIDGVSGCTDSLLINAGRIEQPTITPIVTHAWCEQATGSISATVNTYPVKLFFEWNHNLTLTDSVATNLVKGTYKITVKDTVYGCTDSATVNIESVWPFKQGLITQNARCNNPNGVAIAQPTPKLATLVYRWSDGVASAADSTRNNLSAKTYTLRTIDTATNCATDTTFALINLNSNPRAMLTSNPDTSVIWYQGEWINLTASGENYTELNFWVNQQPISGNSYEFVLGEELDLSVKVLVKDEYGCTDSLLYNKTSIEPIRDFPNVVTPNGDGKNDVFTPTLPARLYNYNYVVRNRWGQEIFSGKAGENWNPEGTPAGIYSLTITFDNGNVKQGWISVIR